MNIPSFWARTTKSVVDARGRRFRLDLWEGSEESDEAAHRSAEQRASELEQRLARGHELESYPYGTRVLREERISHVGDPEHPDAVITRNRYGALILNAHQVAFIDVDLPDPRASRGWFSWLRGASAEPERCLERVREACQQHASASFRLYRTRAGFRVLVTDPLMDPASETTQKLLRDFGADPLFVRLCRQQQSFRARLTPKPWRCGCTVPGIPFPRESPEQQDEFTGWLWQYEDRSASHAVCHFIEELGRGNQHEATRGIVSEHDRMTKAHTDLPLA